MSTTEHTPARLNWQHHSTPDKPNVLRAQSNFNIAEGEDAPFWYSIDISGGRQVFTAWYEGDDLLRKITKSTLIETMHACQRHDDTPVQEQTP